MSDQTLPKHIAFIMDGNGRWATQRNLPRSEGHREGVSVTKKIVFECFEIGIPYVSLYAFSSENWNRPQDEIDQLFKYLRSFFRSELPKFINKRVRIICLGDRSRLSSELIEIIGEAEKKTAAFTGKAFLIGLNYGGRPEIIRAVNNIIASGITKVDEALFERFLYTAGVPDPDLLVRTSERRLSNFMLYQCAYTELCFIDKFWPDFDKKSLEEVLKDFAGRKRRFGAIAAGGGK